MPSIPSFLEDHISQIPALQLLQNLGYAYLRPQEVFLERRGRPADVLLEGILEKQLRWINRFNFKGREHNFSDANIQAAIHALRDISFDGLIPTNERIYDLLSLGKSFEALEIDRIIEESIVVDWLSNLDVQNEIRNRIDDFLYELKERHGIELSYDDMDLIVENSLNIARVRYV